MPSGARESGKIEGGQRERANAHRRPDPPDRTTGKGAAVHRTYAPPVFNTTRAVSVA